MKDIMIIRDPIVAKIVACNTRWKILMVLRHRAMTPSQLSIYLGKTVSSVMHHLKVLEKYGLVKLVKKEVKGNIIEKWYMATAKKYIISYELSEGSVPGSEETVKFTEDIARKAVHGLTAFGFNVDTNEELVRLFKKFMVLRSATLEKIAKLQKKSIDLDFGSHWLLLTILTHVFLSEDDEYMDVLGRIKNFLGDINESS